jgi:hypothetical protein
MQVFRNAGELGPNASRVSHLTSLRGAIAAISGPTGESGPEIADPGSKRVPITEVSAEHRHWLCEQWWDVRAQYTLMLDAADWEPGDIADFLGRPIEDIEAILDPKPYPRMFTVWQDGGHLIGDEDEATAPDHYRDCVMYVVDGWLEQACQIAGFKCERDGFGDVEPILRAWERRYRRRREAAEQRGISTCPYWYADVKPAKNLPLDREGSGFAASLALRRCVIEDARHAVRINVEAEEGHWSPELMKMWVRHYKAIEGLEKELWRPPSREIAVIDD